MSMEVARELARLREDSTPGSPVYVWRLRDQAAVDRFARFRDGSHMPKEDVRSVVRSANFLVETLGYEIPEDKP